MNKLELLALKETLLGEFLFNEWIKDGFIKDMFLLKERLNSINENIEGPKLTFEELYELINTEKGDISLEYYLRNNILKSRFLVIFNKNIKKRSKSN
jgi:hypothetical protein